VFWLPPPEPDDERLVAATWEVMVGTLATSAQLVAPDVV
jgi:hypothetical protein